MRSDLPDGGHCQPVNMTDFGVSAFRGKNARTGALGGFLEAVNKGYVPKGSFVVEYTVRLNNPGTFGLPATRVEAMYAPEMFGEAPNAEWVVQ